MVNNKIGTFCEWKKITLHFDILTAKNSSYQLCFVITTQLNVLENSNVIHVKTPMVMHIHYLQLQNHTSFVGLFFKRSFKIVKSMKETTINKTQLKCNQHFS